MQDQFIIEEYRNLHENKRKHEEKCFQTIVICLTAYGIIIGFSKFIPNHYIPLAMLAVLWICLVTFRNHHYMHRHMIAYIILKYERNIKSINFQQYKYEFEKHLRDKKYLNKYWFIKIITTLSSESFIILTLILFGCYLIFGWEYIKETKDKPDLNHILYLIISLIGYISIIWNIYKIMKRGLDYYIKKFNNFNKSIANK